MRLRRLHIDRYLLLRDLDLQFDRPGRLDEGAYALDFLIGLNGSGKSTVLRALTQIVSDLRADQTSAFNFELEYEFKGRDGPYFVSVAQRQTVEGPIRHMTVQPESLDTKPVFDADSVDQRYLPPTLVVYTTGSEEEWERLLAGANALDNGPRIPDDLLDDPLRRSVIELPGHPPESRSVETTESEPPFLLVRASYASLVTLCGLLAHLASNEQPLKDVLNSLELRCVAGFSLRFRLHTALSPFEAFNTLKGFATRHIQQDNEHLLVFDLSVDPSLPSRLINNPAIDRGLGLYAMLARLLEPDLSGEPTLQQVNLFLERRIPEVTGDTDGSPENAPSVFLFDWLSDGEQSFLSRMALLAMLDTEDGLILLDEPEVHFNDYWKLEVIDLLDRIMQKHSNHLLITTHSSILLSDVTAGQVVALVRGPDGWARQQFLRLPLLAVDPSEIMVNWFGTGRSVGRHSTRLLSEAVEGGDIQKLERLLKNVGPGFWRYRIEDRLEELRAASD
jgi:energy-coupling factor transporter ATP-binding protein EcfA2